MTDRPSRAALGPVGLVLVGILSVQLGAAIAKGLFDVVSPTAMVWLRLVTSAVVLAVLARPRLTGRTRHDWLVVVGFGLSSVLPYSCELVALRTLRPAVFGILMSLEPAAAALAAIVVLHEHLSPVQWLAIACVVAASVGATRTGAGPGSRSEAPGTIAA